MQNYNQYLRYFLLLVGVHSFSVGLGLIAIPSEMFEFFGYSTISEPFFRVQGGVFHIAMVLVYFAASRNPAENAELVRISYLVKFLATIFLISYFLFVDNILVVLLSGIIDFAMGIIIFLLNKKLT